MASRAWLQVFLDLPPMIRWNHEGAGTSEEISYQLSETDIDAFWHIADFWEMARSDTLSHT